MVLKTNYSNFMKKTVIITGGAQGIGKVCAQKLLENNFNVVVADANKTAGEELLEECQYNENLIFKATDIANEQQVMQLVETTLERFGGLYVLVNNAAISANKPVHELSLAEWQRVIDVNLTGTFLCTKYAALHLKKSKGHIINLCSTRAFMSEANTEAYSASKGGIFSLTHALAMSLAPEVRVNCISPGWIDALPYQQKSKRQTVEWSTADHTQHPVGRIGTPDDIAQLVLFLCSNENSFITGQNFVVDGGMTRKMIYV